jgi:hypothetical protein
MVNDAPHRGEVVLILAAIAPIRPAIGECQIGPRDTRREFRYDLTVTQNRERDVQSARDASQHFVSHVWNSVFVPNDLIKNAFPKRPTIHDESLSHHGERPRQLDLTGTERRPVISTGDLLHS